MPGEDEYWERVRERMEMGETKPEPVEELVTLDDELEDLEKEYGCKLEDLDETDIEDIVYRLCGEYPLSAEYDPVLIAILYKVDPDWR